MAISIVLVGPMGAGKTTLGKKLAKQMGLAFTDTDKLVTKAHGPISKIFEKYGEDEFRRLEHIALRQALETPGVVATGGGIVLNPENRDLLRNHFVVFLDSSSRYILPKINLEKRPLLKDNPDAWDEIYASRLPLYKEVATATLFTGGKPVKAALNELIELMPKELI